MDVLNKLRELVREDRRYALEAYEFVLRALQYTVERLERHELPDEASRHVSGRELLAGIRDYALEQFGYLARFVFARWGVRRTEDFGEIVFNLVAKDILRRRPEDTKADFQNGYDFAEAFDGQALEGIRWRAANR